jgi:uncharacterized membrane protein (UPF0127 family)
MKTYSVKNGEKNYKVLFPVTPFERGRGMKLFESAEDCECDGMLFQFSGYGFNMTMEGMGFSLFMVFIDKDGNVIKTLTAEPTNEFDTIRAPRGAVYCLELLSEEGFNEDEKVVVELLDSARTASDGKIKFPKKFKNSLFRYDTTKEFNKNKSFIMNLDHIPEFIYGINKNIWFLAEGEGGLYNFEDAYKNENSNEEALSLNEISQRLKDYKYDFIIGYKKEIKKYLAPHPISGKMTEWKSEDDYKNKLAGYYVELNGNANFEKIISKFPELSLKYSESIIATFPLGEEAIATSAEHSYEYAQKIIKGRFELGESAIAKDDRYSYRYARDVINGRFELGEQVIATNAETSYRYAKEIIKGRFELGEPAIAKDSYYSGAYAKNIIKGRWKLGESAISKDSQFSLGYAAEVIKGRFELGEPAISRSAKYSYEYSTNAIKSRFELGESVISRDSFYSYHYAKNVLHGRFELGEDAIAKDVRNSYFYAIEVIKGRFPLGEPILKLDSQYWKEYCDAFGIEIELQTDEENYLEI